MANVTTVKNRFSPADLRKNKPHGSGQVMKRLAANKVAMLGLCIIVLLVMMAVFAPLIAPYSYEETDMLTRNIGPTAKHLFGTDSLGRDIFSRLLYGGRYSLGLGFSCSVLSMIFAIILGSVAGYFGNWVDNIILRFCDIMQSIPGILIAIVVSTVLGTGYVNTILAIAIGGLASGIRLLRGQILSVRKEEYRCDLLVLLAHATVEESKAYAAAFPEFQIVVTGGGNPQPPKTMEILAGGTRFIEVGEKGMDAIVLGIYDIGKIEYQRVPLDSRFADSPDMKEYMRQYQQQLKRDGLAGLGIRQVPHSQAAELGKFVGSKKCKDCHEPSYDVWKKSGHSDAWKTLVELEVPRTHDPECISCHVIGWHPTEYFPYESGFLSEEETPDLIDVGCENCHGPGEKHVEAEMGADAELQKKLQKALVVTKEQSQHDKTRWCLNCHDLDNSPDFNFEEYWPQIEHSEDIWEDEK